MYRIYCFNSSKNNHNSTNDFSLKYDKKYDEKLAKIHGHKFNENYKKLLKSNDPILTDSELVKVLSDPDDNIRRKADDIGIIFAIIII